MVDGNRNGLSRRTLRPVMCRALASVFVLASASCSGQQTAVASADRAVEALHVRDGIYMLVGTESNAVVQAGDQGVLLVDTLGDGETDGLLARVRSISDRPIRHIINTHAHATHIAGNTRAAKAGDALFNSNTAINVNVPASHPESGSAAIYSHENAMVSMTAMEPPLPFEAWPTSTYFTDRKDLYFNGEAVRLFHQPNAHTDGDTIVHFRNSDVIVAGGIFVTTGYPYIDVERGGTLQGIIDALNTIIRVAVPEALQEGGTLIVPGRGRLCDESEVVEYRDMLTIIRNIIQERINEGQTLAEIQATRPTSGFDPRYADTSGDWTPEDFVEVIYNELMQGGGH